MRLFIYFFQHIDIMDLRALARATPLPTNGRRDFTTIGNSPQIEELRRTISLVAPTNVPVLVTGESGTGKELVARAIHKESLRLPAKFVAVNCAAIPAELVESELFGHVRGSFTGAVRDRKGRFQLAHEGTLFLDEIGDMPLTTQSKLLRVLELGEFEPVGGTDLLIVDTRVVCATNKDLAKEIEERRFRRDLYERLNVVEIPVPPLREHLDDVPLLLQHFLEIFNTANGRQISIRDEAITKVIDIAPLLIGNIRGLRGLIERAAVFAENEVIAADNRAFTNPKLKLRFAAVAHPHGLENKDEITEDKIRAVATKYAFRLKINKRGDKYVGLIKDMSLLLEVSKSRLRAFVYSGSIDLIKIIETERRRIILDAIEKKITKKELAKQVGISRASISNYCKNLGIEWEN